MSLVNELKKIEEKYSNLAKKCILNNRNNDYRKKYQQKLNLKTKLPPIIKVTDECSFTHEIFNSNVKFNEIKQQINTLKQILVDENDLDDLESDNEDGSVDSLIPFYLDDVIILEEVLQKTLLEYEQIKFERVKEQNNICKEVLTLNSCPFEKRSSDSFLRVCKFKKDSDKNKSTNKIPKYLTKRRKIPKILPRTQKSARMNVVPLTDEEKVRIQSLLSGVDDDQTTNENNKTCQVDKTNAFQLSMQEKNQLDLIEEELKKFIDTCIIKEAKNKVEQINYEHIDWKEIKNLSIKEIDKALDVIHNEKRENKET